MNIRRIASVVLAVAVVVPLGGCSGASQEEASVTGVAMVLPAYASVADAARASDAVFVGTIAKLRARIVDRGGSADVSGIPMNVYDVTVARAAKGDPSGVVALAWIDVDSDEARPLTVGGRYVFLAERVTAEEAPGMKGVAAPVFVPVGGNAGVLDLDGDTAVGHGGYATSLRPRGAKTSRWQLDDVLAAAV